MSLNIHTLSSLSSSSQVTPPKSSSSQRPRFMTLADLPREKSAEELIREDLTAMSAMIKEMADSRERTTEQVEQILKMQKEGVQKLDDALEQSRKTIGGDLDSNEQLTPEAQEKLRKERAQFEETMRTLKANRAENTVLGRIISL